MLFETVHPSDRQTAQNTDTERERNKRTKERASKAKASKGGSVKICHNQILGHHTSSLANKPLATERPLAPPRTPPSSFTGEMNQGMKAKQIPANKTRDYLCIFNAHFVLCLWLWSCSRTGCQPGPVVPRESVPRIWHTARSHHGCQIVSRAAVIYGGAPALDAGRR